MVKAALTNYRPKLNSTRTGIKPNSLPNAQWLVDVLATYDPGNEIFNKNYMPVPKSALKDQVNNDDGFFDNLPPSKSKKRR